MPSVKVFELHSVSMEIADLFFLCLFVSASLTIIHAGTMMVMTSMQAIVVCISGIIAILLLYRIEMTFAEEHSNQCDCGNCKYSQYICSGAEEYSRNYDRSNL